MPVHRERPKILQSYLDAVNGSASSRAVGQGGLERFMLETDAFDMPSMPTGRRPSIPARSR